MRKTLIVVMAGAAVMLLGVTIRAMVRDHLLRGELLTAEADDVTSSPRLVRYALSVGEPAYAAHCAACHGADLAGDRAKGAPSLKDPVWLYDFGRVSEIERTILYGIRSGLGKARNITDMPAFGLERKLTPDEVKDVATYVLSLSTKADDPAAITRGARIFQDKGVCYDCHGAAADGNPDYGAPALAAGVWLYGGDPDTVYRSIYFGRHGLCPDWIDRLDAGTIRALAVTVYERSHPGASARNEE